MDLALTLDTVGNEQAASQAALAPNTDAGAGSRAVPHAAKRKTLPKLPITNRAVETTAAASSPPELTTAAEQQDGPSSAMESLSALENIVYNAEEVRCGDGREPPS